MAKRKDAAWRRVKKQPEPKIKLKDSKQKSRLLFLAAAIMRGNDRRNNADRNEN